MLIGNARTIDLEGGLLVAVVRTTDFGDCPLIGIVRTNDFGDSLMIGIVRTIDLGDTLLIGIVRTIDVRDSLLIAIVSTIVFGCCLLVAIVWTAVGPGGCLSIKVICAGNRVQSVSIKWNCRSQWTVNCNRSLLILMDDRTIVYCPWCDFKCTHNCLISFRSLTALA